MPRDETPPIWERIKNARQRAGITQQELSMRTGMTVTAISGLENGRRRTPRYDTIERLSEALECNLMAQPPTADTQRPCCPKMLKMLDKFLTSDFAKMLKISKAERRDLRTLQFFHPHEAVDATDWVDWVRLRRKIRDQSMPH